MIAKDDFVSPATGSSNDRALKPTEAAFITGFSVKTLANWRVLGRGPPYRNVNGRVRYLLSSTQNWLHSHREQRSTSDMSDRLAA